MCEHKPIQMNQEPPEPRPANKPRTYRWPWFLLGAIIVGILLAAWWLSKEVARTRNLRDMNRGTLSGMTLPSAPGSQIVSLRIASKKLQAGQLFLLEIPWSAPILRSARAPRGVRFFVNQRKRLSLPMLVNRNYVLEP